MQHPPAWAPDPWAASTDGALAGVREDIALRFMDDAREIHGRFRQRRTAQARKRHADRR